MPNGIKRKGCSNMSETPQSFLTSCTKALHDKADETVNKRATEMVAFIVYSTSRSKDFFQKIAIFKFLD